MRERRCEIIKVMPKLDESLSECIVKSRFAGEFLRSCCKHNVMLLEIEDYINFSS